MSPRVSGRYNAHKAYAGDCATYAAQKLCLRVNNTRQINWLILLQYWCLLTGACAELCHMFSYSTLTDDSILSAPLYADSLAQAKSTGVIECAHYS
jgi:hypothetical protein